MPVIARRRPLCSLHYSLLSLCLMLHHIDVMIFLSRLLFLPPCSILIGTRTWSERERGNSVLLGACCSHNILIVMMELASQVNEEKGESFFFFAHAQHYTKVRERMRRQRGGKQSASLYLILPDLILIMFPLCFSDGRHLISCPFSLCPSRLFLLLS